MTKEEDRALGYPEYWDGRYAVGDGCTPTHEWFRSFTDLKPYFQKNLFDIAGFSPKDNPVILHLGSGDSLIPIEFESLGYKRQLCLDFSPIVVKLMSNRYSKTHQIEWGQVDVRNMDNLATGSIDVAFDKGTLDAMIYGSPWNPPDEVKDNTCKYMKEVHRTLKEDGFFLYVTFRQPHFVKPLLNPEGLLWDLNMQVLGDSGSFDYYGYVCKKHPLTASTEG